jgi:glycosyltransferase involved in cell wall biosynthesis
VSGTFLHLETGRHLYGGPRQVLLLLDGLRDRGQRVTLACPADSAIAAAARDAGHTVITHPITGDLDVSAVTFLTRLVQQQKPDLLHAHSRRGADYFGGLAAVLARVPAVLTRRVDNPDTPLIGTLKYRAYDRVVAISDAVRAQLEREGVEPARLRTIRSAVDADACQPDWSRGQLLAEFGLDPAAQVVAVVAQLIPRKGHALLLDAWPLVRARCPDAQLLVLGAGPLAASLKARVADHESLESSVTFAGFRPDLRRFLGRVDLLVHAARHEGLGVSLLEAQAAGVPVVALASGGVPEAIADGTTGLLVAPAGDPARNEAGPAESLADAVATLLGDTDLRRQMGRAAAARMRAGFSPARMVDDYLALYREVLG